MAVVKSRAMPVGLEEGLEILVVLAALATIPLTIAETVSTTSVGLAVADWVVWSVFLAEYLIRASRAASWGVYARRHWLSVAVIVLSFPLLPTVLALVRVGRLVRLLRLLRVLAVTGRAVQALGVVLARRGLVYVASVTTMLVIGSATTLTVLEPETVKGDIGTALWWAMVTVTTVGYGDVVPATPVGRLIGVALMFAGLGTVSTLAASIAAYFVAQDEGSGLADLAARLDRIEQLLRERGKE
jgi:voltage-gated potassium channel